MQKKTALVTGAARRLGRAIALSLADSGHDIVVHYRSSRNEAEKLCGEIRKKNVKAWPLEADLEDPQDINGLIQRATRCAKGLSVLVNNASIFPPSAIDGVTLDDFNRNMLVNAWAPFALSRSFATSVQSGSIVNILDGRVPGHDSGHIAYIFSKHMLLVMTRICALEFAPRIRVNGVSPGLILPPAGMDFSYVEKLTEKVPLRKYGKPQDIADAVVFLAASEFITGQIVYVDGGRNALQGATLHSKVS
jgi:NAD(P)-dependent dehydrogenase (short-subunit alcohol dehydrogenase family)